jgi:hypothetical protein
MKKNNSVLSKAIENNKTKKSETDTWTGSILYMTPEKAGGYGNVCPYASLGCVKTCLFSAGRGVMAPVIKGRLRKTALFFEQRELFFANLKAEIEALVRKGAKEGKNIFVRLNGTSDISWENFRPYDSKNIFELFPSVTFYDYTKGIKRALYIKNNIPNYHITFSRSEVNEKEVLTALEAGINVAVVFKSKDYPKTFLGRQVLDGDKTDMRFLEGYQGKVIGLFAKGKARYDVSGFVVNNTPIDTPLKNMVIAKGITKKEVVKA